jgi:hypothetical protein
VTAGLALPAAGPAGPETGDNLVKLANQQVATLDDVQARRRAPVSDHAGIGHGEDRNSVAWASALRKRRPCPRPEGPASGSRIS